VFELKNEALAFLSSIWVLGTALRAARPTRQPQRRQNGRRSCRGCRTNDSLYWQARCAVSEISHRKKHSQR